MPSARFPSDPFPVPGCCAACRWHKFTNGYETCVLFEIDMEDNLDALPEHMLGHWGPPYELDKYFRAHAFRHPGCKLEIAKEETK